MATQLNPDEEIVRKALEIDSPSRRVEFVQEACAGDPALAQRVDALLAVHESGTRTSPQRSHAEGPGVIIDRYKILEKIGEGGMAVVYVAEQHRPIRRRVALKIIKLGMDTKQVIACPKREGGRTSQTNGDEMAHAATNLGCIHYAK